jgi:hypothetical protein
MSVKDLKFDGLNLSCDHPEEDVKDEPFNFVLLDGTWSNSAALYRRLKVSSVSFTFNVMHSLFSLDFCLHLNIICSCYLDTMIQTR